MFLHTIKIFHQLMTSFTTNKITTFVGARKKNLVKKTESTAHITKGNDINLDQSYISQVL